MSGNKTLSVMNLFDVYPLFDIEITKGRGCHVYDADGTEYLDLYGGHAVVSVGHCHPVVVKAIEKQASQLMFYSNSVINPFQQQLAEKLGKISGSTITLCFWSTQERRQMKTR